MIASTEQFHHQAQFKKRLIALGILLALAAPLITGFLDGYFRVWFEYPGKVFAGIVSFWLITAIIMAIIRYTEADSWSSMWRSVGFQRIKLRTTLVVLIVSFLTLLVANVLFVVLSTYVFQTSIAMERGRLQALPIPLVLLLYLTGIFVEEILYRGYALQRLFGLTGSWTAAGLISGVLFVAFHVPAYPLTHILGMVIPATIVVTLMYIRLQNISYTVMMHAVMNLVLVIAYVVLPLLPGVS